MYGMGSKGVPCCLLLLQLNILVSVGQTFDRRIFEQCYGSMWKNYLTASCDANQVISVISLKAYAKRRDTTCPQEETAQTPLPSDSCCRHNISDCGDIYDGVSRQDLHLSCDGRQDCFGIPIAWMDTPSACKTREHLNKTSYMRMEYECIHSITYCMGDTVKCHDHFRPLSLNACDSVINHRVAETLSTSKDINFSNTEGPITNGNDDDTILTYALKLDVAASTLEKPTYFQYLDKFSMDEFDSLYSDGHTILTTTPTFAGTVIGKLPDNILITDNAVYIQNTKYPDGNTFPPGTTMTCFVEAFPESPIVVTAIYLKFLQLQVASGVCGQRVTIEDGTKHKEISCESNNSYNITDVYISSSHFIKFTVFSNILSNRDWRFWFKFKGVEPQSRITLACGSQAINSTQYTSPGIPMPVSTNPSLRTTTALQTAPPNSDGQNDGTLLIAILVPLAVILIVVIVVIILCCKKTISDACCNGQGAIHPEIGYEGVGADTEKSQLQIELEIKKREEEKKANRKERKKRKKEKKLQSEIRFLEKQQRMNEINRFRVAGYAASAFHPPVMRPYYPGNGQENYYIPDHNMYDQQLPLTGTIYGYPAGQNLNFQNTPLAGVQSSSTSLSTDGNYKNAFVPPASLRRHQSPMSVSQRASEVPLIFHTGQFGGQFVPQGSVYKPYENPALRQWRVAGMAATFASHPLTGRPTVEIGSVDNPNESESNQSYDDSIV